VGVWGKSPRGFMSSSQFVHPKNIGLVALIHYRRVKMPMRPTVGQIYIFLFWFIIIIHLQIVQISFFYVSMCCLDKIVNNKTIHSYVSYTCLLNTVCLFVLHLKFSFPSTVAFYNWFFKIDMYKIYKNIFLCTFFYYKKFNIRL